MKGSRLETTYAKTITGNYGWQAKIFRQKNGILTFLNPQKNNNSKSMGHLTEQTTFVRRRMARGGAEPIDSFLFGNNKMLYFRRRNAFIVRHRGEKRILVGVGGSTIIHLHFQTVI